MIDFSCRPTKTAFRLACLSDLAQDGIRDHAEFIDILQQFIRHCSQKLPFNIKNARYLRQGTGRIRGQLKEALQFLRALPSSNKKLRPNDSY